MVKIPENGTWGWHGNKVAAHGKKNQTHRKKKNLTKQKPVKCNIQGFKKITHNARGLTAKSSSILFGDSSKQRLRKNKEIKKRNSIQ